MLATKYTLNRLISFNYPEIYDIYKYILILKCRSFLKLIYVYICFNMFFSKREAEKSGISLDFFLFVLPEKELPKYYFPN